MKLKNIELSGFVDFLYSLDLQSRTSRMRTRLINLLEEKNRLFRAEHLQLLNEYAKKDYKGEPISKVEGDDLTFELDDPQAYNNEYQLLALEDVVIDVTAANADMLRVCADVVLSCTSSFSGAKALEYDRYCDVMEGVIEEIGKLGL